MRFLLDVDGVVADLVGYLLAALRQHFDNVPAYEELDKFLLTDMVPPEQRERIIEVLTREGTAQELPVMPGAQEGIQKIRNAGHEIHWVTSRWRPSKTWVYDRDQWLAKHFDVDPKFVASVHHKYITHGDVFIDDKLSNVEKWAVENPTARPLLFDHPWNKNVTHLERFKGWKDLDRILATLG